MCMNSENEPENPCLPFAWKSSSTRRLYACDVRLDPFVYYISSALGMQKDLRKSSACARPSPQNKARPYLSTSFQVNSETKRRQRRRKINSYSRIECGRKLKMAWLNNVSDKVGFTEEVMLSAELKGWKKINMYRFFAKRTLRRVWGVGVRL